MSEQRFRRARHVVAAAAAIVGLGALPVPSPAAAAAPPGLAITASGANGVGRATIPGLPCDQGGDADSWHYGYEANLAPGAFTALASSLRLNLDAHGEAVTGPAPDAPTGFLQGEESTASLVTERGTVVLRLQDGGSCEHRTARLSATTFRTSGTWVVDHGSGSFATAAGSGNFTVDAGIAPGADNPWTLDLDGNVTVAPPSLQVTVVRSWWGNLGLDYLNRRPSVHLRITNTGAGDALGLRVTSAASPSPGTTLVRGAPVDLGDLLAGDTVDVVLQYQFALLSPCFLVLLNCAFDVNVATSMTNALDASLSEVDAVRVTTPLLPVLL